MRNVNIYLLKILLLVGLFIGCDKMLSHWNTPVPLWEPPAYEDILEAKEVPGGPAILIQIAPTNRAITQHVGGILLEFHKKPENFKTDPPLDFYAADEVESQLGEGHYKNIHRLLRFEGPVSLSNPCVYIIGAPTIRDEDRIKRLLSDYWGPDRIDPKRLPRVDHSISVIDVSWGPAHTQRTARLAYIVIGPE